jgi:tetratricopeptide (TPR) repeat protein
LLAQLVKVVGSSLADKAAAIRHARRAYDARPDERTLELLETTSLAAGTWDVFVEALEARLEKAPNLGATARRALRLKLASVHARTAAGVERAIGAYKAVIEEDPGDTETIGVLDELLRSSGRTDDIRWLFGLRAALLEGSERAALLEEWATVEDEELDDRSRAIALLEEVLAYDPERASALRVLARIQAASGQREAAVATLSVYRDLCVGQDRARREIELAMLYLDGLGRPEEAFDAAVRALDLWDSNGDATAILERLMDGTPLRARAASVLVREYAKSGDDRREATALAAVLADERDPGARKELYLRIASIEEQRLDAAGAAFDVVLRGLGEFTSDLDFWDRASELAQKAGRSNDFAQSYRAHVLTSRPAAGVDPLVVLELCQRAVRLHDETLGDAEGSLPYLERILSLDPANGEAFRRLKLLLIGAERWEDLERLLDQVVAAASDARHQVELLNEVAVIAEDVIGDPKKAVGYYERVLEIDGEHTHSLDALERLYESAENWKSLAELLSKRIEIVSDAERADLKLRLGRLLLDKLNAPEKALDLLESVLLERSNDAEARHLVEQLVDSPRLGLRAAEILEPVYEARDEVRSLVRVLELRRKASTDRGLSVDLLRRISVLRDERLRDDAGAFASLAELLPLDPDDVSLRDRFVEIGRRLGDHAKVAGVLSAVADASGLAAVRGEILMEVARISEDLLGDAARAQAVYQRVLAIDPTDPAIVLPAARALERIHASAAEHALLAEVLELQVTLEDDGAARARLQARLATIYEEQVGATEKATRVWKARLQDEPSDVEAYAALERLYERGEQWGELVESLRQRLDAATEADERRRCLVKIARTLAEQLDDVPEAIVAWRTVFDEVGPERGTIRALAALYERANAWSDVADMLDAELSTVDDTEERLAILVRLGDTRRKHQGDLTGSLEAYRQALALDPSSVACRRAIEDMLEIPEARRAAAATLQPLYEADDDAAGLLRVLDVQISVAEDTTERLDFLRSALRTAEASLPDSDRAFAYAVRGTKESIAEPSIGEWVDTFERLAVADARWTDAQALYLEIVEDVLDGDVQHELRIKLGEIARARTNDAALAIVQFSKALSEREDDARALHALEELYTETGDAPKLLEILRRRVDAADTDAEKRTLLFRVADIEKDKLGDPSAAIATYERVLDLGFDEEAAAALEPLYDDASRLSDLAALYERQIEAGAGRNADLRVKAARVALRMDDVARAFDELAAALDADPSHAGAVTILEDLLRGEALELRARAAEILEQVYLRRGEWANVKAALVARLAVAIDPAERREFLTRLATLHEEQLEDFAAALENVAELLHEDVSDRGVWVELERLAKVAGAKEKLASIYARELDGVTTDDEATADLCRKTAEIFADLGDAEAALRLYRRAHAFAPDSRDLFDAIDALLVASERHEERVALFRATMDARDDVERQRALHTIARLERDELRVPDRAIGTLREIVELDPTDDTALDALSALYRERVQHRDLADLLVRRAEGATSAQVAIEHRFALAEILKTHLDDASGAVDQLELIVSEVPTHEGATKLLEALAKEPVYKARVVEILRPLYEQSSDYQPLARLNEERLELANDPQDKIAILRETARLYEDRGSDPVRAFDAIRAAFEIDSDDGETRSELERLAAINGKYRDLAETLERGVERSMDNFAKRDLLASIARIYDSKLDSPRKSLDALTRLIDLDALEPEPLEAMDTLAVLLSDWTTLALVLEKKLEIASSDDQPALYRRLAETRLDLLSDEPGAIDAYENAHELQPENTIVIDALLGLYDGREHDKAADFYRKRIDLLSGDETDLRYDLNIRAAECFEVNLGDKREAIGCLMGALEARPSDATCLAKLERLFRAEEMWSDLLENLRQQAALIEDKAERTKLRLAVGDLELDHIENPADALVSYRTVLEDEPSNTAAIAAVCRIAESYEDLRLEAVATVEPSLRDAERHAELVDVLKLRLDAQADGDAEDRLRTRRSIAALLDEKLGRPAEAQVTLLLALDDAPEDASLHDDIESLSERVQGYARYADALATRADSDPAAALALTLRLGRLAEEKLADDALATTAYARALEIGGDSLDVLRALDRLYSKRGENYLLADILDRRAGLEVADYEQADVLTRLALIQYDQFDNPTEAISTLQRVIDRVLEHEGARAALEKIADRSDLFEEVAPILETVYRGRSDSAALAKLYGKRIGFADSADERVRMRLDLARVLEDKSGDPKTAQHALQAAFRDDPTNPEVFSEVERLAAMNSDWTSAAVALESAASERDDLAEDVRRDLFIRAAEWRRDRADDAVGAEGALESALGCDPGSETLLKQLIDLQRAPGRERQLIGTTRRLAALDSTSREAAYELRRDAKALAQDVVGDPTLSEALVREMLEVDGDDAWALEELGSLREASGDYAEAFELLERRATLAASPTDATRLEHAAARMARRELGDAVRATEIYQRVFDRDLEDDVAAQALREIYAEQEDATSLVALLATLVERVRTVDERVALRLERAKLLIEKLESPGEAIVELSAILDEDRNATAIELLEGLFESTARYEELVGLLTSQSEEARGRGDTEAAVRYGLRLGDVAETKLGSVERALDAYRGVVDLEPRNHQALTSLARLYEDQGDRTEAASMLEQLLDASTSEAAAAFAMRLADLYASADDDSALRRVLERAVDLGPSPIEARAKLASVYERTGAWVELSALLVHDATAAESVEQKVDLYRRAASIQSSQLNDPAAAADLLLKASEFGPDDRDLLLALCDAQSASGRSREAIEALQKIVDSYAGKRTKELASIHARIARAHRASGDDEKALAELDVAFKIDPASVSVLREIGLLSFELASTAPDEKAREVQLDRATKAFKSLLLQKLEADAPIGKGEVFFYLAEISVRQGDEKKALQMLERSLENAKDFAPAKELLARLKA